MRLIDADALVALIQQEPTDGMYTEEIVAVIAEQPTIEAAPVVHGRWIEVRGRYICSECKSRASLHSGGIGQNLSPYCPNCGARMDGDADG